MTLPTQPQLQNSDPRYGHEPVPLVSVVMIFWNAEAFLTEAIDSVLSQTHTNLELLLVNDGSTDGSADLAGQRAAMDSRIRLLAHSGHHNRGTGQSRNLGLKEAQGQFIAFLDADDVYEPDRLARHVAVLQQQPRVGSVISRECYWRQWADALPGARVRLPDYQVGPHAELGTSIPAASLLFSILATPGAPMPGICSITFRQNLLANAGLIPDDFVDQYEDQVLIAKLLIQAPTWVLDACLARYRQHPDSLTHRARLSGAYCPGRPHQARDQYLNWLRTHLQQQGAWSDAWEEVLINGPAQPAGRAGNVHADRLRKATLQVLALLPAGLLRPSIRQLWQLRDARIRKRALRAAKQLNNHQAGTA